MLVNDLKCAPTGRWSSSQMSRHGLSIVWKTEETTATCLLRKRTRVPALWQNETSGISHVVCFFASTSALMLLIWFLSLYRLTARDHKAKLADKLIPWTKNTFDMSCHCCASTGWCPSTHIKSSTTFPARAKFLLLVEKHVAFIFARRQFTGLRLLATYRGQDVQCSSPKHYRPQTIRRPRMDGHELGLRYQKLQGFQTPSWRYHRFGWRFILNEMKQ